MTDCVLALSQTKWFEWLLLWWSVNHQGIILHIIIVLHQRCLNCLNASRDTLCSIHAITTSGVTHRNGAIKHIFYTNQIHGGSSADCSLFILSLHALALHLAVKILLKSFCMKIWARWPYIHLSVVFPPECQQIPHFVTQPILLSENIPNIWHKSSAKRLRGQTRLKR